MSYNWSLRACWKACEFPFLMTFVEAQSLCHVALVPAAGHRASATRVHAPFLLRVAAAERSSPCCEWALTRPVLYRVVCTCQYQSPDPSTPLPHLGILTFVLYICVSISGKHLNFLFLKYWKLRCRSLVICLRSHLQCVVTEGPNSITAASFITVQIWKQPKDPWTDDWSNNR